MPFATGTAQTAVDMQVALNTHLVANGWTNLTGETDQACASPKSARYWRLLIDEPDNGQNFIEIENLEWRTTLGGANQATVGANYSFNIAPASGTGADLVSGTTPVRTPDLNDHHWQVIYDFGAPTTIRQLMIKCDTLGEAPEVFWVQWSHDLVTWTTMQKFTSSGWSDNETRTFDFDDGTLYVNHKDSTHCRRRGYNNETTNIDEMEHGIFAWQGPGYDAARRVHINCTTNYLLASSVERWVLSAGTDFDAASIGPWNDAALGADTVYDTRMLFPLGPFTYWIYSNSLRVIVIVKNGLDDYISMYLGFMKAFAKPEDYPFPLYVGGASSGDSSLLVDAAALSSFCDSGELGYCRWRDWNGGWNSSNNRQSGAGKEDQYEFDPISYNWPWHTGSNGDGSFPTNILGDKDIHTRHWMDAVVPTVQNELPLFPVIVMHDPFGCIGALDGVFAVPRGSILSAEQVITISAQNYRVFTNRDRNGGNHYFAIRED